MKEKHDNEIKEVIEIFLIDGKKKDLANLLFQLKKSLRQFQRDRERETADHGVMVRELQTLISTERNKCETLEHQVDKFIYFKLN